VTCSTGSSGTARPRPLGRVESIRHQLTLLRGLRAATAIPYIRQEIGYDRYIDQYCQFSGSDPVEAKALLATLEQIPD